MIISVAEPEQANRLIDAGLIWHHELHDCEPFDGSCVVTQCFKCYKFGHVARVCQNLPRCGCCAGPGHVTNDCLGKDDKSKYECVNCHGRHQSWARECPERAKHKTAAQLAYSNRPTRFQPPQPWLRPRLQPQLQPRLQPRPQPRPQSPITAVTSHLQLRTSSSSGPRLGTVGRQAHQLDRQRNAGSLDDQLDQRRLQRTLRTSGMRLKGCMSRPYQSSR